jgi:hypothetical protein
MQKHRIQALKSFYLPRVTAESEQRGESPYRIRLKSKLKKQVNNCKDLEIVDDLVISDMVFNGKSRNSKKFQSPATTMVQATPTKLQTPIDDLSEESPRLASSNTVKEPFEISQSLPISSQFDAQKINKPHHP